MSTLPAKVKSLSLKQFTAFSDATFHFSPGINVIIGANATGKSHVLKIIYTLLKVCQAARRRNVSYGSKLDDMLVQKLEGVFRFTGTVSDLIHNLNGSGMAPRMAEVSLDCTDQGISCKIYDDETRSSQVAPIGHDKMASSAQLPNPSPPIYLPAIEFLSVSEGFIAAYTNRETPFDETFYDLSLALNALPLRSDKLIDLQELIGFLAELIAGKEAGCLANAERIVTQKEGRFYLRLPEGELNAQLVAEGYRKMATLLYLLRNGSLSKDSILFWDEPEANLNPKLVVKMVELLRSFAALGMQIFVTTHDYLFSHELSLLAEYPSKARVEMKFFALHKPDRLKGATLEAAKTLAEIEHNAILDEFSAHYDRQVALFTAVGTDE